MLRPRRSVLFVPGDQPRKLERAATAGADAVVLDLEDAVAPDQKSAGRVCVAEALGGIDYGTAERIVRVNADPEAIPYDLEAAVGADALMLPKVEVPTDLERLHELSERIIGRRLPVIALAAETPVGVLRTSDFLSAFPAGTDGIAGWMWGSEDLAAATGCRARGPGEAFTGVLALARDLTVLLAAATATDAIDTVYPNFRDLAGLVHEAVAARDAGFAGKGVIHPDQVGPVNDAMTPGPEEVARALAVIDAFSSGDGVATLDGQMLDLPHLRAAQATVARSALTED